MAPRPPLDDDDEPPMPKMAMDEIEEALAKDPVVPTPTARPTVGNDSVEMRKLMLEEMRFHLEERKELHKMDLEIRKVEAEERDKAREQRRLDKELELKEEKGQEHWLKAFWRPAMGWLYMLINFFDFVVAPVMTMAMPVFLKALGVQTVTYTQWTSLTLQNGGLIHLAFGAILGVAAFARGAEKTTPTK